MISTEGCKTGIIFCPVADEYWKELTPLIICIVCEAPTRKRVWIGIETCIWDRAKLKKFRIISSRFIFVPNCVRLPTLKRPKGGLTCKYFKPRVFLFRQINLSYIYTDQDHNENHFVQRQQAILINDIVLQTFAI